MAKSNVNEKDKEIEKGALTVITEAQLPATKTLNDYKEMCIAVAKEKNDHINAFVALVDGMEINDEASISLANAHASDLNKAKQLIDKERLLLTSKLRDAVDEINSYYKINITDHADECIKRVKSRLLQASNEITRQKREQDRIAQQKLEKEQQRTKKHTDNIQNYLNTCMQEINDALDVKTLTGKFFTERISGAPKPESFEEFADNFNTAMTTIKQAAMDKIKFLKNNPTTNAADLVKKNEEFKKENETKTAAVHEKVVTELSNKAQEAVTTATVEAVAAKVDANTKVGGTKTYTYSTEVVDEKAIPRWFMSYDEKKAIAWMKEIANDKDAPAESRISNGDVRHGVKFFIKESVKLNG